MVCGTLGTTILSILIVISGLTLCLSVLLLVSYTVGLVFVGHVCGEFFEIALHGSLYIMLAIAVIMCGYSIYVIAVNEVCPVLFS